MKPKRCRRLKKRLKVQVMRRTKSTELKVKKRPAMKLRTLKSLHHACLKQLLMHQKLLKARKFKWLSKLLRSSKRINLRMRPRKTPESMPIRTKTKSIIKQKVQISVVLVMRAAVVATQVVVDVETPTKTWSIVQRLIMLTP